MAKRILVRAPNWLGDAVMATPFLKRLAARSLGSEVEVLAKPGLADLFRDAPGVKNVLVIHSDDGPWSLSRRLRERKYETAYVLPTSFSSALPCWLAGIPHRIGYAGDFRSGLLTEARPLDERFHYVRRYLGLLGETGMDVHAGDFFVPRATEEEMHPVLGTLGSGKILAVAPGSRAPARRWFPERFAGVINGLGPEWSDVLLLGAAEDRPAADEVARLSRRTTRNLCGSTSIPVAAALLARASALLTNESGLMHVGWAVGTPLVVVAGPSNPRVTSPFGPQVRVLQTTEVPCVPCVRNTCYRPEEDHILCLKKITVEQVLKFTVSGNL